MQKIIQISDMSYSIPYGDSIIERLNLEVSEGQFLGILGHNGAGKTTLMDILMGFRRASSGLVEVLGEDPHAISRLRLREVAFLSQDVVLKGSLSIRTYLEFHSGFFPQYSKNSQARLLKRFALDPEEKIGSLSTGQQKKVQVVAGLASLPKLILIDEITAVMDPETRKLFFEEIELYRKENPCAVVLATNIAEDLVDRCDRILFVKDKRALIHSPSEIESLFNLSKAVA